MGEKIESETQSLKRLQYLDLAKAVGMLCVLIGHSFISEKINTVIYAFHMPLFFFISGYLCKPQKVALKKINQKCGHILVPYVITTFFTIILSLIFESGIVAYSARTAHPFQRNGAPFRFKLSKAQHVY